VNLGMNINGEANAENSTALIVAARDGDIDTVNELLQLEFPAIDINMQDDDGNTALMLASENGNINIVNALLDYFNEEQEGDHQMVYTSFLNTQGRNALMLAVMNDNYVIAQTLLQYQYIVEEGFSFNLEDTDGNTVLMLAQLTGNNALINLIRTHLPANNVNTEVNYPERIGTNNGNNNLGGGARRGRKTRKANKRKRSTRRKAKRSRRRRRRI